MKYSSRHLFALLRLGLLTSVLLTSTLLTSCTATPGKVWQTEPVDALNLQHGIALKGYDPVAYFAEDKPEAGNAAIAYQWQGATWLFSTPEHREAFQADPQHYAPQFGGYCAFAVSRGTTADADPDQWAIVGGKLYVNNNVIAKKFWDQDRPGNIAAGDTNWPLIPKRAPSTGEPAAGVSQITPAGAPK
jgi:YHS domain-containing protein